MTKNIRNLAAALTLALTTLVGSTALAAPTATTGAQDMSVELDDGARFDAAQSLEGEININTASAQQLELLPGIGPSIAARIVDYREEHPYKQRNNIMRIKGIGQKTFAKIKDFLVVEGQTTLKVAG